MEFDWRGAIDRNCEILCDIAFRLIVMAGIEAGRTAETLPRRLYLRILAILRPAEFATRRLIAMAACKLPLDIGPLRRGRPANPSSPLGGEDTKACERSELAEVGEGASDGATTKSRHPAFALFDPFKPFPEPWLTPEQIAALDDPAVPLFIPASPPNEPVDARSVCRRIRALQAALLNSRRSGAASRPLARPPRRRLRQTRSPDPLPPRLSARLEKASEDGRRGGPEGMQLSRPRSLGHDVGQGPASDEPRVRSSRSMAMFDATAFREEARRHSRAPTLPPLWGRKQKLGFSEAKPLAFARGGAAVSETGGESPKSRWASQRSN